MTLDSPDYVRRQYASTEPLATRASVWRDDPDAPSPLDIALASLAELPTRRLLEVGCGNGAFSHRCHKTLACEVAAVDISPAMVKSARAKGVDAVIGDVEALP